MWALRRASIQIKNRGLSLGTARLFCVESDIERCYFKTHKTGPVEYQKAPFSTTIYSSRSYNTSSDSSNSYMKKTRAFSSESGAKSDDDFDVAFPEHEGPPEMDEDDDPMSESELLLEGDIKNELANVEIETESGEKKPRNVLPVPEMTKAILAAPSLPVKKILEKWVEDGNEVTQTEISLTVVNLRKRRMFVKALQLSEWLESKKHFVFTESNYASRVDLIAKVRGVYKAQDYVYKVIPESSRGEIIYRTLLENFASTNNLEKSEELFNKMKKLFPITSAACDQLLLLYKRVDKNKIGGLISLMEKENVKPSQFTYQILIDAKGQFNDIRGMEKIVEAMKSEGVEPNIKIQITLARHYAVNKLKDKSVAILKEIEGGDIVKNRWACQYLLPVYASLGNGDEVDRIWGVRKPDALVEDYLAAIEAFGQLKRIEDAESAHREMMKKIKNPSSKHFVPLLNIYADHKLFDEGKELVKTMSEIGCGIRHLCLNALVKLYIGAGEVKTAYSILENFLKTKKGKPLASCYMAILDEFANRGDIHGAENVFLKMKKVGYAARVRPYRSLLYAYINANAPAYGFRERMKGDNVIPTGPLHNLLARANAFRKSPVTELLE